MINEAVDTLQSMYAPSTIIVTGSRTAGTHLPNSDLDVILIGTRNGKEYLAMNNFIVDVHHYTEEEFGQSQSVNLRSQLLLYPALVIGESNLVHHKEVRFANGLPKEYNALICALSENARMRYRCRQLARQRILNGQLERIKAMQTDGNVDNVQCYRSFRKKFTSASRRLLKQGAYSITSQILEDRFARVWENIHWKMASSPSTAVATATVASTISDCIYRHLRSHNRAQTQVPAIRITQTTSPA